MPLHTKELDIESATVALLILGIGFGGTGGLVYPFRRLVSTQVPDHATTTVEWFFRTARFFMWSGLAALVLGAMLGVGLLGYRAMFS